MRFNTQYDYSRPLGEYNSGELITDTTGYLPPEYQIKKLFSAGRLLDAIRDFESKNLYDAEFEVDPDDIPMYITRTRGVDPTEVQAVLDKLSFKMSQTRQTASEFVDKAFVQGESGSSSEASGASGPTDTNTQND